MTVGNLMTDRAAKQRACEEILKSRTFSRSEQLVQFLRYLCELELDGRGAEITEYSIATNALNRPADYAPGEDSSVRSRAHALRRKLKEYYDEEAPRAELRIDLPKGSYRPVFVPGAVVAEHSPVPPAVAPRLQWRWLCAAAAAGALLASVLFLLYGQFRTDAIDPVVREAWGPLLERGNDSLILIGAPPVLRAIPSQQGVKPLGNVLEPAPNWVEQWYRGLKLDERGGPVYMFPTRGYAVFCDSLAALAAGTLIGSAGATYHTVPEPSVRPMAIHENGLLVIGAPGYTAYASRVLRVTPYSIWFDTQANEEVLGQRLVPGSPVYRARRDPQTARYSTVYGLITVLPSQPGRPRPERTVIFSGIMGSPGAQAALEFFRSTAGLHEMQERFRKEGYTRFPGAYQIVVRCGVDAETAMNAVYETHKAMSRVPVIE